MTSTTHILPLSDDPARGDVTIITPNVDLFSEGGPDAMFATCKAVTELAAMVVARDMANVANLSHSVGRPHVMHHWTTMRAMLAEHTLYFEEMLQQSMLCQVSDELRGELTEQVERFPLRSNDFDIIESTITTQDGRTTRMLQRKPKEARR